MHVLVFWFSILWPLSHGKTWTRFVKCLPCVRHSRVGGNPVITRTPLDSRLRGNDLCVAHGAICVAHGAICVAHGAITHLRVAPTLPQ